MSSSTNIFHWKEHLLASILRNGERGFGSWQVRKHSELILRTIRSSTASHSAAWSIMASATEGKWPQARALPKMLVDSLSVVVVLKLPERLVTVTYKIKVVLTANETSVNFTLVPYLNCWWWWGLVFCSVIIDDAEISCATVFLTLCHFICMQWQWLCNTETDRRYNWRQQRSYFKLR